MVAAKPTIHARRGSSAANHLLDSILKAGFHKDGFSFHIKVWRASKSEKDRYLDGRKPWDLCASIEPGASGARPEAQDLGPSPQSKTAYDPYEVRNGATQMIKSKTRAAILSLALLLANQTAMAKSKYPLPAGMVVTNATTEIVKNPIERKLARTPQLGTIEIAFAPNPQKTVQRRVVKIID